jgi:hypothetical protein
MPISIEAVRKHLPHYLSDEVGASAGLTLAQLQQVIAGTVFPEQWQLDALGHRMHITEDNQ